MTTRLFVAFAEHVPQRDRDSMRTTLGNYGNVAQGTSEAEWNH
jgi:hypothetical protein